MRKGLKILAVMVVCLLTTSVFIGCSSDGDGPKGSTNSQLIGTWKCIWDYTHEPRETMTMKIAKNGKLTMTVSYGNESESETINYYATDNTIYVYNRADDYEDYDDMIYYRIVKGKLFTYDDEDDYELDAGGSLNYKMIWEKK